jgi:hypothetical protein
MYGIPGLSLTLLEIRVTLYACVITYEHTAQIYLCIVPVFRT